MASDYTHIFFDLDGTITDPAVGITNSAIYALKRFGIIETEREKLYKFIGPPLAESFREFYNFSESQAQKAIEVYREYYTDKGIFELSIYEGIPELLRDLYNAHKKVILATSKPEPFARRILDKYELTQYFSFIAGSDMAETRVKKGDVLAYAMNESGLNKQKSENSLGDINCVMVGDRKHDVIGAKQNGIDVIGVLFGYGGRDELTAAGATFIAESVGQLKKLLL